MIPIQAVCTGNNGRSPMAEMLLKKHAAAKGVGDEVHITSSGSGRHPLFKEAAEKPEIKLKLIQMGFDNGIYRGELEGEAESVLATGGDSARIDNLFDYLMTTEALLRSYALWEVGLMYDGEMHKPTQADPNARLILPMTEQNAEQVRRIYIADNLGELLSEQGGEIEVVPFNEFAGVEGEVVNPFCKLLPEYQQSRDGMDFSSGKVIDRVIAEYL